MTLPSHSEVAEDINTMSAETEQLNSGNAWLQHLQGGKAGIPYLKKEGRLKKKPKVIHVSAKQRRIFNGE
jgi:hypothetical protein